MLKYFYLRQEWYKVAYLLMLISENSVPCNKARKGNEEELEKERAILHTYNTQKS